jgi:hypothetical protein
LIESAGINEALGRLVLEEPVSAAMRELHT